MSTGKVVLGTLAGLAAGALAGILFAPEKGSTTRRQIMDKGNDFVDELKSKFDELRELIIEKIESTQNEAENLIDSGNDKYDDVKRDVKNAASKFKHEVASDSNNPIM